MKLLQIKPSLVVVFVLLLSACSMKMQNETKLKDKYVVTYPMAMDTFYFKNYVCDIHSINNVEIRARVKGYIDKIHVDEGKVVKKGQLLFSISNQEYKENVLIAKANLKNAIAEAKAAELELFNTRLLVEKNVVSKTELSMAQSKLEALNAKIEEAKSHEVTAKLKLSFTEIRAPFEGVIDRIPNKVGSLIDEGDLITTLSDNQEIFAYFNVSEKEYLDLYNEVQQSGTTNREVSLILANEEEHSHSGKVETIEGEFDNVTGNIAFRARFPNPSRILKHGSSGMVKFKTKIENALIIPQKSTFEIQDKIYVYVIDDNNTIKVKNITIKQRLPHLYVIESGLSKTDRVLFEGIQEVKDGMVIQPELMAMNRILHKLANS